MSSLFEIYWDLIQICNGDNIIGTLYIIENEMIKIQFQVAVGQLV